MKNSGKVVILLLGLFAITGCGTELPNESDIANAWQNYTEDKTDIYTAASISNLKCHKAADHNVICEYSMGNTIHSDVFQKTQIGDWKLVALNKPRDKNAL